MPTKKRKTATRKATPPAERLATTESPAVDLEIESSVAILREEFHRAHIAGMAALANHDFQTLGDAIVRERDIIDAQKRMIARRGRKHATRRTSKKR